MTTGLALGATTFGFLYRASLDDALATIAAADYRRVELALAPPHLNADQDRTELADRLARYPLEVSSVNPVELNPISLNPDIFACAQRGYGAAIEIAATLGAPTVVMITGRQSPLIPMPEALAREQLARQLEHLVPLADRLGVTLTLEPVPFGFLQTAREVVEFLDGVGAPGVGITVDCTNAHFAGGDPGNDLRAAAERLRLVHISDSWRTRWAHTRVGTGEIDFAAFAETLRELDFVGPTIYELVDGDDPAPRLDPDRSTLGGWGWTA